VVGTSISARRARTRAGTGSICAPAEAPLVMGGVASETRREGSEQRRRSSAMPSSGTTEQRSIATQIAPLPGGEYQFDLRPSLASVRRMVRRVVHLRPGGERRERDDAEPSSMRALDDGDAATSIDAPTGTANDSAVGAENVRAETIADTSRSAVGDASVDGTSATRATKSKRRRTPRRARG